MAALDWYKSHFAYHYQLQAGAERIDLSGNAAGKVTEQEALKAAAYIEQRKRLLYGNPNPIQTMASLHRARKVSDDALRKIPAPVKVDPLARLQELVCEAQQLIKQLQSADAAE